MDKYNWSATKTVRGSVTDNWSATKTERGSMTDNWSAAKTVRGSVTDNWSAAKTDNMVCGQQPKSKRYGKHVKMFVSKVCF